MADTLNRLSARFVATVSEPGLHADGGNLYLSVSATGSRSWRFVYRFGGKQREAGLGPLTKVSLAAAREKAAAYRALLGEGRDPLAVKQEEAEAAAAAAAAAAPRVTFKEVAEAYIAAHAPAWKNDKHRYQWRQTMTSYVYPVIGDTPVADVATSHMLEILEPLWTTKSETAIRVRGRIETILDAARVRGHRDGPNPAAWRGHLSHILPAKGKVAPVEHHPAMPHREVAAFVAKLRAVDSVSAAALEFTILTAARSGEVLGMTWPEIDLDRQLWIVPAPRMKGGREHRVPLAPRAIEIINKVRLIRTGDYVFPGSRPEQPLSNMTMTVLMRRMGFGQYVPHGFRSCFRDWVSEETAFPTALAERALAHVVRDATEAAYARSTLLERRIELMNAWAAYVTGPASGGNVLPFGKASSGRE